MATRVETSTNRPEYVALVAQIRILQIMPPATPPKQVTNRAAFTVLEIAIVVTIIGILAALAIPHFNKVKERSIISTLKNDLRVMAQEFSGYYLKFDAYPASQTTAGLYPSGMEERMSYAWIVPSVVGGEYRWTNSGENGAYIEITTDSSHPLRITAERLADIDSELDDGDPNTGLFRLRGPSIRYYLKQ